MKYLLDVNVLLAAIWSNHSLHSETFAWLNGKSVVLCPLAELGFLRISTNRKVIGAPMADARNLLEKFAAERKAERITDDLPALESKAGVSEEVTDHYLADLSSKHGLKFATLDGRLQHAAAERIVKAD